jgi:hypothetical protein
VAIKSKERIDGARRDMERAWCQDILVQSARLACVWWNGAQIRPYASWLRSHLRMEICYFVEVILVDDDKVMEEVEVKYSRK